MIKRVKRWGNSHGIALDKTILALVGATEDTEFRMSVHGDKIVLEPIIPSPFTTQKKQPDPK